MLFIFDMGNVITTNVEVLPEISRQLGIPERKIGEYCGEGFRGLMIGTITIDDFWRAFSGHFGIQVREDYIATCFKPTNDSRMVSLVGEIRRCGYRVVCGTNTLDSHYRYHLRMGDYRIFDAVYASHLMGCAKPEGEFYNRILSSEHREAEEAVFIDDMAENVDSAALLGIRAFLFRGYDSLLEDFLREGIEWPLRQGATEPAG